MTNISITPLIDLYPGEWCQNLLAGRRTPNRINLENKVALPQLSDTHWPTLVMTMQALTIRNALVQRRTGVIARTPPATVAELESYTALMLAAFKVPSDNVLADPTAFLTAQRLTLQDRQYSLPVIAEAFRRAAARETWLPSTAVMVGLCEQVVAEIVQAERQARDERALTRELRERRDRHEQQKAEAYALLKQVLTESEFNNACTAITIVGDWDEWIRALYGHRAWATEAAKFFATIEPHGIEKMDTFERLRLEMKYFDIRAGRTSVFDEPSKDQR
jgi:hypothetical protein